MDDLKTEKSRRRIDLSAATLDALREHRRQLQEEGYKGKLVFPSLRGCYLRRPNLAQRHYHPMLERAGLPRVRFHDLRHTAATLLLLANERTKVVSERLGHASTTTTEKQYQHVLPTMQKEAAEKMGVILKALMPVRKDDGKGPDPAP